MASGDLRQLAQRLCLSHAVLGQGLDNHVHVVEGAVVVRRVQPPEPVVAVPATERSRLDRIAEGAFDPAPDPRDRGVVLQRDGHRHPGLEGGHRHIARQRPCADHAHGRHPLRRHSGQ